MTASLQIGKQWCCGVLKSITLAHKSMVTIQTYNKICTRPPLSKHSMKGNSCSAEICSACWKYRLIALKYVTQGCHFWEVTGKFLWMFIRVSKEWSHRLDGRHCFFCLSDVLLFLLALPGMIYHFSFRKSSGFILPSVFDVELYLSNYH